MPVRRVVKYGSKMRGRFSALMPVPRSRTSIATRAPPLRAVVSVMRVGFVGRCLARRDGMPGVGEQIDEHQAQPFARR